MTKGHQKTYFFVFYITTIFIFVACGGSDDGDDDYEDNGSSEYGRSEPSSCESTTGGDCFACDMPPNIPAVPDHLEPENLPWEMGRLLAISHPSTPLSEKTPRYTPIRKR